MSSSSVHGDARDARDARVGCRRARVARRWALLAPFGLLVSACGPSMRTMVESDMRFEHCYRIDEDGRTSLDQKRACWHQWTARYERVGDRVRVRYAKDRVVVLDGATSSAAGAGAPAGRATERRPTGSPTDLSPYAPPPSVARTGGDITVDAHTAHASPAKWQACNDGCSRDWRACVASCGPSSPSCGAACDDGYSICMKTCI